MKRRVIALFLILCCVFAFTGCKGDDPDTGANPSSNNWKTLGLENGFKATVKGTLESEIVIDDGIEMKWSNSDEASLDSTISWLNNEGYSTLSSKEEIGSSIVYSSTKTVDGKKVVAEIAYFTADATYGNTSFKAGDLLFSIYPDEESPSTGQQPGNQGGNNVLTAWPSSDVTETLGYSIPEFTAASSYSVYSAGTAISVTAIGVGSNAYETYQAQLTSSGFTREGTLFVKSVGTGAITVSFNVSTNGDTSKLNITATFTSNVGSLSSWPAQKIATVIASSSMIPDFEGGSSYNFVDVSSTFEFGFDLPSSIEEPEVNACRVTVFGIDTAKVNTYIQELKTGSYEFTQDGNYFYYDYTTKRMSVELSEINDGKIEVLIYEAPSDYFSSSYESKLPTNVKITYEKFVGTGGTASITTTSIKIGNDYYYSSSSYGVVTEELYYEYDNGSWNCYIKDSYSDWEEEDPVSSLRDIEEYLFDFIVNGYDNSFSKSGVDTIVGKSVDIYSSTNEKYYVTSDGLVFKYYINVAGTDLTDVVTTYDTSVSAFTGIDLPE